MFTFSALFYPLLTWKFNLHFFTPRPLQGRSPCQAMIETHRVVNVTNQPTNRYHCVLGDRVKARGTYREYARLPSYHLLCVSFVKNEALPRVVFWIPTQSHER